MKTEIKPTDRLARERMSRRWTMAKKLLWTFWVLIIVCIVMILFDTEKGKVIISAFEWPMTICAMCIGAVMGIDSFKKKS